MELTISFLKFNLRVLQVTLAMGVLLYSLVISGYLATTSLRQCLQWSYFPALVLVLGMNSVFSPYRHFPAVDIKDIRVLFPITDVPRGESALKWAKAYPQADVVRVRFLGGANVLFPVSTIALRDVLSTNQTHFEKPRGAGEFLARVLGYGLILSQGSNHTRQRKHLTASFKIQNIRALHKLMLAKADLLLSCMESDFAKNGKCDITIWGSKVTLDIIGEALMNEEYDALTTEHQPVHDAFTQLTTPSSGSTIHFGLGMILPTSLVALLPTETNASIRDNTRIVRDNCEASLARMKIGNETEASGNIDTTILRSIMDDPQASHEEIVSQMVTFLGAGHETTATSIAWVTHLLTLPENLHYQDKLRDEISADPDCTLSATALESLPWLNGICEETLRLYPPVTTTGRVAVQNTSIAGHNIPKGSMVVMFPWANNRDPRHWGDGAEMFQPERWMDKRPDGSFHVNMTGGASSNYCNMTFLHGNRSCIGRGFAKAELRVILARLFSTFRVRRLPGDNGVCNPVGSLTIKPEGGLFVTLERV